LQDFADQLRAVDRQYDPLQVYQVRARWFVAHDCPRKATRGSI
jgi:hypothetical protein